ncbi:CRISPR-associated endonuclease Csn1 [Lachnospiraceae bacterium A10]|nr:CRISPR-associated endonuclease Csn1 [Lachnospiraceae bacterium A10]
MEKELYVGLDIGTNSVGYAVTDEEYNIRKFHGEPAWGSVIFDEAKLNDERREKRTARRRLDRRKQRVSMVQDIFAKEIAKVDADFYKRIKESGLYRTDVEDEFELFCDPDFTDRDYHEKYPTIHHLIYELMTDESEHDVRLVYLAVAWLVKHRGHFLKNIDVQHLDSIRKFKNVYDEFMMFFEMRTIRTPWETEYTDELGEILKAKKGVNAKNNQLKELLYDGKKISKDISEDFPYSREGIIKLLAGGSYKLQLLFGKEEYAELGPISLSMDDEELLKISSNIGDDFELIMNLRKLWDWAILVDVLGDYKNISEAKIALYNQHKNDLENLKKIIKKYIPEKYNEVFRNGKGVGKYESYVKGGKGSLKQEDFLKYLGGVLKNLNIDGEDEGVYKDILEKIETNSFLPKQINTDNRVIPYQVYQYELIKILDNACKYLQFLNEKEDGYTNREKIERIFTFRIPYFVGPLNSHSEHAWLKRFPGADGKIYPWNFNEIVDLDESESEFIRRMTNKCTYLPGEDVLPKGSLLYQKFVVLNELNNIKINNQKIDVELKQSIYRDLFMRYNKVSKKKVTDYLISNNYISKGEEATVSGIDVNLTGTLSSWRAFHRILTEGILTEREVERIIERSTYSEEKSRLRKWIQKEYPSLNDEDVKYICGIKLADFGRLSRKFLNEFEGADKQTGEVFTVISALWNTQDNLSEIVLSNKKYTFNELIKEYCADFYEQNKKKLSDRLDDMYISNAVRRPIYRTLAILKDVEKAFGVPDKIFVEMARGSDGRDKGRRKESRLEQILNLYKECRDVDVRELKKQLEQMGEYANNRLQSDKLFLYYMQLGKCMYTGKTIRLEDLGSKAYDIDHIYPQAYVTDDSVLNNKVLVLSEENGKKSDVYPISSDIRSKMGTFWKYLYDCKLITETKYKRLIRSTPFSDEEKMGFISRQYVETTQATKAVATILNEKYPDTEIVYCKASIASRFRNMYGILKSRNFNDLHHAIDAYLNVVTGNVYHMRFTNKWFNIQDRYSVNPQTIFNHDVIVGNKVVWDEEHKQKVIKQAKKQTAHFVKYAYFKHGALFDQMPCAKSEGLVPLKKGLDTTKYGGYNKPGVMFFIPVRYKLKKKTAVIVMSVELLHGKHFLEDDDFAKEYAFKRLEHILGKPVDEVEFPMGMRPWKVNTVLSLDGYRVCITGTAGGGSRLIAQGIIQFSYSQEWINYIHKIEKFVEKVNQNRKYIFDEEFDKVSRNKNIELYDLYIEKYENTIYEKRLNRPIEFLKKGRELFLELSIIEQCVVLLNVLNTFNRAGTQGVDLTSIGGSKITASTTGLSSTINNWKKNYKDVRIIDMSPSGLWEKQSDNLLELL